MLLAFIALLIPMALALTALRRVSPAGNLSLQLSGSVLLGLVIGGWLVWLTFEVPYGLWIGLLTLVLLRLGLLRCRSRAQAASRASLLGLLLVLMVVLARSFPAALDLLWQPVHAWDAYNVWTLRAKVWFGLNDWVTFARQAEYLAASPGSVHYSAAAHYPLLPSLIQLFSATAAGEWTDNLSLLPWIFFLPALALALNGLLERAQLALTVRLAAVYVLISIPLLQAHVAHAGYADLLLCVAVLLAMSHWLQFANTRLRQDLYLALAFTALWPLIKLDGWLWMACLVAALALLYAPPKLLLVLWGLLIIGVLLLFQGTSVQMRLGPLGVLELSREAIQLPGMTRYTLGFRNSLGPLLDTLFWHASWNVWFWIAPLLSILALKHWLKTPGTRLLLVFLVFGALSFVGLFSFTSAAEFAETATASNRLLMPLVTVWIALLGLSFSTYAAARQ